jgi:hypothetical protein
MNSACFQVWTILARSTRSIRSVFVHAGRFTWRLRMIRGFRNSAFSATSSDLLRAWSVSVKSRSEVDSGVVQATKRSLSDRRHKRVMHVTNVRILCTVSIPPL